MFYEENVINGVPMCRSEPGGVWREIRTTRLRELATQALTVQPKMYNIAAQTGLALGFLQNGHMKALKDTLVHMKGQLP